ncbi:MAG: molybdenum cofactor biosynthesis protein MoaE [Rhodospirillales bacterium]|jgi:molybdopterin synthase catalytic subunit|nr:molybdenum cofactor biosynthesis protein MoaE [Rhodospirillales bacterium]
MIRVQSEDFDIGAEIAQFTQGRTDVGGLCLFVGLVRDVVGDAPLEALVLEHYPQMTERELRRIEEEAHRRWPLLDTLIIHRHGRLKPGDRIVLVAVCSAHRQAAFDGCRFLIDWLKTRAPFWKREEAGGQHRWVAACDADLGIAAAWGDAPDDGGEARARLPGGR